MALDAPTGAGAASNAPPQAVNVASVRQYSPLRYPGGKTWLMPRFKAWLASLPRRPETLVEPFAGGAVASLTAVLDDLADRAVLVERDPDVAAFWRAVLERPEKLAARARAFEPTRESIEALPAGPGDLERGFRALVLNRARRGGILADGASLMRAGEKGRGLRSRWYPETLARRIERIGAAAGRIRLIEGDGLDEMERRAGDPSCAFLVDPPYSGGDGKRAGRRLYRHSELDHGRLFALLGRLSGPFMATYEDCPAVRALAAGLRVETTPMKSAHHARMRELVILPPLERGLDSAPSSVPPQGAPGAS